MDYSWSKFRKIFGRVWTGETGRNEAEMGKEGFVDGNKLKYLVGTGYCQQSLEPESVIEDRDGKSMGRKR